MNDKAAWRLPHSHFILSHHRSVVAPYALANSPKPPCKNPPWREAISGGTVETARANHLATLQKRLFDLCAQDSDLAGLGSRDRITAETRYLLAVASDAECLMDLGDTWEDIVRLNPDTKASSSEHLVEYFEADSLVVKIRFLFNRGYKISNSRGLINKIFDG